MSDRDKPRTEFLNRPLSARTPRGLGLLPPLKRGQGFWIVVENSLTLIAAGWEKGQALATALNLAGYRPPLRTASTVHWE
jgi:hypothetical protein